MKTEITKVESKRLGSYYYKVKHSSGLAMFLAPMDGFKTSYAMFGTAYGSVDTLIKTSGSKPETIPAGTAHYLEHKLFESEECSAFERYAKTGANANAFTGFDRTCYLFSCSDKFNESLEILMDFVTHPYFTPETVEKERGIIGQEIKMYDDSADWRVLFNLLCAMYHNNPVKVDIAGTIESISEITADMLYKCYGAFYNLNNMVLTVAGNFDLDSVIKIADSVLKPADNIKVEHAKEEEEPETVLKKYTELALPVSVPQFTIGFKGRSGTEKENYLGSILDEIFLSALCDDFTEIYRRLYDDRTINSTFGTEVFCGRDYISLLFSGESRKPEKVMSAIKTAFDDMISNGIPDDIFECAQKTVYGHYLRASEMAEGVASALLSCHFIGIDMFDLLEQAASATPESVLSRVKETYSSENIALSVIRPLEKE